MDMNLSFEDGPLDLKKEFDMLDILDKKEENEVCNDIVEGGVDTRFLEVMTSNCGRKEDESSLFKSSSKTSYSKFYETEGVEVEKKKNEGIGGYICGYDIIDGYNKNNNNLKKDRSLGWMSKPPSEKNYDLSKIKTIREEKINKTNILINSIHRNIYKHQRWLNFWIYGDDNQQLDESIIEERINFLKMSIDTDIFLPFCSIKEAVSKINNDHNLFIIRLSSTVPGSITFSFYKFKTKSVAHRRTKFENNSIIYENNKFDSIPQLSKYIQSTISDQNGNTPIIESYYIPL
eukprot:TRINITY_DN286_c2_g1_i1.p1 TRINITY_DN286_c2_g1~~TRINITY_DN286_c2_g1_i1.p1  ORF type:complete len:290 (-),score=20.52 TRINITY_DN286_c2_g1_i1:103-972(-)